MTNLTDHQISKASTQKVEVLDPIPVQEDKRFWRGFQLNLSVRLDVKFLTE